MFKAVNTKSYNHSVSDSSSDSDFNSVLDFDSESKSESDSSLVFINPGICFFSLRIYALLNKLVDNFSFQFS